MKGKQTAFGVCFTVSLGLGKHSYDFLRIERVNERATKSNSVELERLTHNTPSQILLVFAHT